MLDPWNGSGTTTGNAYRLGIRSLGFDLNPVMVAVAKASLFSAYDRPSLLPLGQAILDQAKVRNREPDDADPLCKWLSPESASIVRAIEAEINHTLISHDSYLFLSSEESLERLTPVAAFFYIALFRFTRRLLANFVPSNPTWVKKPETPQHRKRPSQDTIYRAFIEEVSLVSAGVGQLELLAPREESEANIRLGNATQLDMPNSSVQAVVTSPPYCTRIDYAVATAIELALLRFDESTFDLLRRSLMGTSTVMPEQGTVDIEWGATCNTFLDHLYCHSSKASKTYYFKSHIQYFHSLQKSISELSRVLEVGGACVMVVQDSYYKEIHNDVAAITTEMAARRGLDLVRRQDFPSNRSMIGMNNRAKKHLADRLNHESVLCFQMT